MLEVRPGNFNWRYSKNDIKPSPQIKRCLFGEPDHDEVKAELDTELKKIQSNDKNRWDFDFCRHQPVRGGRFDWTKLDSSSEVISDIVKDNSFSRADVYDTNADSDASLCSSPEVLSPVKQTKSADSTSTQLSLTDYFRNRKRSPSDKSNGSSPPHKRSLVARSLDSQFIPIRKPDGQS